MIMSTFNSFIGYIFIHTLANLSGLNVNNSWFGKSVILEIILWQNTNSKIGPSGS